MTKDEMLSWLQEGATVRHVSFTSNEWMQQYSENQYMFEDSCICNADDFWRSRTDARWCEHWYVIDVF